MKTGQISSHLSQVSTASNELEKVDSQLHSRLISFHSLAHSADFCLESSWILDVVVVVISHDGCLTQVSLERKRRGPTKQTNGFSPKDSNLECLTGHRLGRSLPVGLGNFDQFSWRMRTSRRRDLTF